MRHQLGFKLLLFYQLKVLGYGEKNNREHDRTIASLETKGTQMTMYFPIEIVVYKSILNKRHAKYLNI